jgi:hypothetical protein
LDEWRLVDTELDAGAELDAAEWREGRQCGARRQHGPRQGLGQADGAWPRREARVRMRARGSGGGDVAEGGVRPGAEARSALSGQATWVGAARARHKASRRLIRGPAGQTDDL